MCADLWSRLPQIDRAVVLKFATDAILQQCMGKAKVKQHGFTNRSAWKVGIMMKDRLSSTHIPMPPHGRLALFILRFFHSPSVYGTSLSAFGRASECSFSSKAQHRKLQDVFSSHWLCVGFFSDPCTTCRPRLARRDARRPPEAVAQHDGMRGIFPTLLRRR